MNFLSHFYFDRYTGDSLMVTGTVLPDLIKNAKKEWNIRPEKNSENFSTDKNLSTILKGWNRHLAVDRIFHCSDFFLKHSAAIRVAIAPVLAGSSAKPFFVAHIALEIMLDSLLLTESILGTDRFYSHLKSADRNAINRFLQLNKISETDIFFKFFDEFIEAAYLNNYRDPGNIIYSINRICMRLWPSSFNETQKLQLTAILFDYREILKAAFMDIFNDIEQLLNS
ncbi:hypothetical protein [Rubrolithibacter danxiaensis]|uniref:hypothetical protein n=1 Tax=Rubrolithibacter danxiaensis TaxID=3390805 RepID=UPI003BF7F96F